LFSRIIRILTTCSFAGLARSTLEVLTFKRIDVVNDDGENSRRVIWVGRSSTDISFFRRIDSVRFDLELGVILKFLGERVVDTLSEFESWVKLRLFEVSDTPGERASHCIGIFKAHELVGSLVNFVGLEHEFGDGNVGSTDEIVGGKHVGVPQLNRNCR